MLDRVGSWAFSQGLIGEYGRIQGRLVNWQTQISTGKVGDQFADTKDKAGVLAAAKLKAAETKSYVSATKEVLNRLDVQDLHLQELTDIAGRLRLAIADALSTGHAPAFMNEVKVLFDQTLTILNARVDGKFLYGGSRTDQAPVNTPTLASLAAAPTVADAFDDTDFNLTQRIDENETVEIGMTASDIGTGIMQMFKDIAALDAGVDGPFGANLSGVQTTFLIAQNAAMNSVHQEITTKAAINGARHNQVSTALERHDSMSAYFAKFIGDIEDVDLSEAVARLNQDQVAAQAAGRMIAQVNAVSLLNFL